MYDVVIIGSGFAGMTAGIYAARAGLSHVIVEKEPFPGGQIIKTAEVDNYPGFEKISGTDLAIKVRAHCKSLGVKFTEGEVVEVKKNYDNSFSVVMKNNSVLECKNIIIAVGAKPRLMNVPGEIEYIGRGVSYCATCDGPLYRKKNVVVFGGGDSALRTALYLADLAENVLLVHRRQEFRADKTLVDEAEKRINITIIRGAVPESIVGDELVSGVYITDVNTKEKKHFACDGVFVAIGSDPDTGVFGSVVELDKTGYIIAGEDCKTNVEGIYAAGDCRTGMIKQLVTAAADGAVAVSMIKGH